MKRYMKPAVASTEIEMESLMTSFSVVDKGTDSDALTNKKHGGWSSDMWTKPAEEEEGTGL